MLIDYLDARCALLQTIKSLQKLQNIKLIDSLYFEKRLVVSIVHYIKKNFFYVYSTENIQII